MSPSMSSIPMASTTMSTSTQSTTSSPSRMASPFSPYTSSTTTALSTPTSAYVSPTRVASSTAPPKAAHSTLIQRFAILDGPKPKPNTEDAEQAYELLLNHRRDSGRWSVDNVNAKDANAVLERLSQGLVSNPSPSLVLALISQYGGSVNYSRQKSENFLKKLRGKDQVDVPSKVLQQAVQNCSDEVVHVMAQYADAKALGEALPAPIAAGDALKVMILMAKGADASPFCSPFLQAVESGPDDLIETLLRYGAKGPCQSCRNIGLVRATAKGYETKAYMLLNSGADVTSDNAAAIYTASRCGMQTLAIQMISLAGPDRLDPSLLDMAVGEAYNLKQYQILRSCLKNGAKGPTTDKTLIEAVRNEQISLVDLLVGHGASVSYEGGLSLQLAVRSGKPQTLMRLLQGRTTAPGVIASAMSEATKLRDRMIALDMIDVLLSGNVHGDSATEALIQALDKNASLGDDQSRLAFAQRLLSKGRADINAQGARCLTQAISGGWIETVRLLLQWRPTHGSLISSVGAVMTVSDPELRISLLELLLQAESTSSGEVVPDHVAEIGLKSAAMVAAAQALLLDVLQFLVAKYRQLPEADLVQAWKAATSSSRVEQWLQPEGLVVIHFLLQLGVTGQVVDDAFCKAVTNHHRDGVELLSNSLSTTEAYSRALYSLVEVSTDWHSVDNVWLVSMLLGWGCDGHSVNFALLEAVRASANGAGSEDMVEILLTESDTADVNVQNGEALKMAIRGGKVSLLKLLVSNGQPRREIMTQAFAATLTCPLEEKTLLDIVKLLAGDGTEIGFDVKFTISGLPPLAACLDVNPSYTKLVKRMIKLGCDLEAVFQAKLYDEEGVGEEATTVLLWACRSRRSRVVTGAVFDELIAAKANVNFTAPISKTTPLVLASKFGLGDIVTKLIAAKAITTTRDCFDSTALFYASKAGDIKATKELAKAKSRDNDGSLHEAARNMHSEIVRTLIKYGHDANFPSSKPEHDGRTALQELAYMADGSRDADALENTLAVLKDADCDSMIQCFGKYGYGRNALFLALENVVNPIPVTKALLDIMWRKVNEEQNIFSTRPTAAGSKRHYSATTYLNSEHYMGKHEHVPSLQDLLFKKRCENRFYWEFGAGDREALQPLDAEGMPAKIANEQEKRFAELEKRRLKKLEHDNKLQREREDTANKLEIQERIHAQKTYHSEHSHHNKLTHEEAVAQHKINISSRMHGQQTYQTAVTHNSKMMQEQERSAQQENAIQRKQVMTASMHREAEQNKARMAYIGVKAKEVENQQKLNFGEAQNSQKLYYQQAQGANALALGKHKNQLAVKAKQIRMLK